MTGPAQRLWELKWDSLARQASSELSDSRRISLLDAQTQLEELVRVMGFDKDRYESLYAACRAAAASRSRTITLDLRNAIRERNRIAHRGWSPPPAEAVRWVGAMRDVFFVLSDGVELSTVPADVVALWAGQAPSPDPQQERPPFGSRTPIVASQVPYSPVPRADDVHRWIDWLDDTQLDVKRLQSHRGYADSHQTMMETQIGDLGGIDFAYLMSQSVEADTRYIRERFDLLIRSVGQCPSENDVEWIARCQHAMEVRALLDVDWVVQTWALRRKLARTAAANEALRANVAPAAPILALGFIFLGLCTALLRNSGAPLLFQVFVVVLMWCCSSVGILSLLTTLWTHYQDTTLRSLSDQLDKRVEGAWGTTRLFFINYGDSSHALSTRWIRGSSTS